MVNIIKCKAKAQECSTDKKKGESKNDQRQQGGEQQVAGEKTLVDGQVVSSEKLAKADKPKTGDSDCPLDKPAGKEKKKEGEKKEGEGQKGEGEKKEQSPCGPDKKEADGKADGADKKEAHTPNIERVEVEEPLPIQNRTLQPQSFTYGVPKLDLDRSALKFPQKNEKEEKESAQLDQNNIGEIMRNFRRVNNDLISLLEKQQGTALQSSARIHEAYNANSNYVLADYVYLDGLLRDNYRQRMNELDQLSANLQGRIAGARATQRLLVGKLGGAGKKSVAKKVASVEATIDSTVSEIIKPYTDRINTATTNASTSIKKTSTLMSQWQAAINANFSTSGGDAMENAANEGRRQTAGCKVTEEIDKLGCKEQEATAGFKAIVAPFEQFARANIDPPMRAEAKSAKECGGKAIESAVDRAMIQLEDASLAGIQSVKSGVKATKSRLTTQLNSARSSLREQADAQQERLKSEAETADKRIVQAHENQKQGLVSSVETYRQSIIDSAPDGVSRARTVASSGAGETLSTFKSLRESHLLQCEQIETGSREGLSNTHTSFWNSSNAAVVDQNEAANQAAEQTRENLSDSTNSRTEVMAKFKESVKQVADFWAMDMQTKYKAQIDQTKAGLAKCKAGFDTKLSKKEGEISSWVAPRKNPTTFFESDLTETATKVKEDVEKRVTKLADEFDDMIVYDSVITDAVRGVTRLQGDAVEQVYNRETNTGNSLYTDIHKYTSGDDKTAIYAYLSGDQAKGAEYELKASIHWYNDDEARIRKTLRSLDDENLTKFLKRDGVESTLADVRDSLGGVDLKVFDALTTNPKELNHLQRLARADAYDLEEKLKGAHTRKEINDQIASFYSSNPDKGYAEDVSNEALRQELNNQMAVVRGVKDKEGKPVTGKSADKAMEGFVTSKHNEIKKFEQMRCGHQGCYKSEKQQRFDSAQEDRAKAIINHGVGSKEDKIALLGIEANRAGGGKMENIDSNLVDPRLNPNVLDPNHYQDGVVPKEAVTAYNQALRDRQAILEGVAKNYGNPDATSTQSVNQQVTNLLSQGQSKLGKEVIQGLVTEPFPSAETSSKLIEYAAAGAGTNETLMKQATTRLDREQIAAAEGAYAKRHPGESLWSLVKSETSGQDFLDMELAWMGKPRNDKEKAEVALFAIHQQKRETGAAGKALMSGSRSEGIMLAREKRLMELVGGSISFSARGDPPTVTIRNANFDKRGKFQGDRTDLLSTATAAKDAAENYSKNIDEWADGITNAIAIIGAVVATVVTGGGASPLLAAAIAGGIGLASMAAKGAIKGGRYGWEEALTDLGMTGVQMLTAGLGQKLQAIAAASKTMGPLQQALLPAVVTGGLDSMGNAVFNENTWKDGFGAGLENVLGDTFKGVLTSAAGAVAGHYLQKIPIGKAMNSADDMAGDVAGAAKKFRTLGDLTDSTKFFSRSAAQSFQAGGTAFLSTGVGLGFDALRGKYQGSWEDAFKEMGKAAGQASFQGIFEGGGEALRDKHKIKFGLYTKPGWMSEAEFSALKKPSRGQEGTAAAVDGSRFRGDLNDHPVVDETHVAKGLKELTQDGGFLQGKARIDPDGDGKRVMLKLDDGSEIPIHFKTVDNMELTSKGVPVAEFHGDGDGFTVHVSSKADPEMIQRAMVHELTEIQHLKRPNTITDDVLKPGGPTHKRPEGEPQLSPHDKARIAELEFMQHQLDVARAKKPVDEARIKQLNDETMILLTHLGVVNDSPGGKHRRELLEEHLSPHMRDAIDTVILATKYRGADHAAALDILVRQWQHHKNVGDTLSADHILKLIRRRLMRMGEISTDRRFKEQQQKLSETIDQHIKNADLVEAMKGLLKKEDIVSKSSLRNDPAADDPHGAQAVRREFGDNPNFQDWDTFKKKFFENFNTADPSDPLHVDRAYHEWSTGAYVSGTTGRMRSVLSDISRPHPDFVHKWKEGFEPQEIQKAKLKGEQTLEQHSLKDLFEATGSKVIKEGDLSDGVRQKIKGLADAEPQTPLTVNSAAELRHELLGEARRIEGILKNPGDRDQATLDRLKKLHHDLEHQAIKLSETLGEAAARKVAELEKGNWEAVPLEGQGAGLPDVVYRNRDTGQLMLLEAKGGGSQLGSRLSSDQRVRVEQGTRAYLESLAQTMMKSTSKKTQDLGAELLRQLAKPDGVDYRLVKQRFDANGKPQTPEVGHFDIGEPHNAAETHQNAAAIPDSAFHGEQNRGLFSKNRSKHLNDAANELIHSGEGIGSQLQPVKGKNNVYQIDLGNGRKIQVELGVVSYKDLSKHKAGRANAEWQKSATTLPEGIEAGYRINVSDRMDPRQIGRALAHDFREVQQDALARGKTAAEVTANEHKLDLSSPHGKARLEEVAWLNRKISEGGDTEGLYRKELDSLLQHLGVNPKKPDHQRNAEIADILMGTGQMTPEIWNRLRGPELLTHVAPFDDSALTQVSDKMTSMSGDKDIKLLLVQMDILGANIRKIQDNPTLSQNAGLYIVQQQHVELVKQLNRIFSQVPGEGQHPLFAKLLPHKQKLFEVLGIKEPPSASRMDMENFLSEIYGHYLHGTLNQGRGNKRGIYDKYSETTASKSFSGEDAETAHREGLIEALRQTYPEYAPEKSTPPPKPGDTQEIFWVPDNVHVYPQNPVSIYPMLHGENRDDFVHFEQGSKSEVGQGKSKYRIYINPTPDQTLPMLRELLIEVISSQHNDASEIKTHSNPEKVTGRAEGLVIYSKSAEGHNKALTKLLEIYRANPDRFIPAVPRMTEPLAHGISVAMEPPKNTERGVSFGDDRSKLINNALETLINLPPKQRTFENFRILVLNEFEKAGIDVDNPHLEKKGK